MTFIVTAITTAVDRAIPKSQSVPSESNPISDETLALIKEKCRLRRQDSRTKDQAAKTCINQLQKQVKGDFRIEMQASCEKFCNLKSDPSESWAQNQEFPKAQARVGEIIQHCAMQTKLRRPTLIKRNSLPNLLKGTSA